MESNVALHNGGEQGNIKPEVAEGHPTNLAEETQRSNFSGRIIKSPYWSSNIQCLRSQGMPDVKEPIKREIRARDEGKAFMLRDNRCSWYQAMCDGQEEMQEIQRIRSVSSMVPPIQKSPSVATTLSSTRVGHVRDVGKEISARANTCSWYSNMIEDEGQTQDDRAPRTKSASISKAPFESKPSDYKISLGDQENDVSSLDNDTEIQSVLSKSSSTAIEFQGQVKVEDDSVKEQSKTAKCDDECEKGGVKATSDTCEGVSANDVDEVLLLKRIEDQQIELKKQQQLLMNRLCKQPQPTETADFPQHASCAPAIESISSTSVSNCNNPRRLKGDIARMCAQRDEGSIKNLIWRQEVEEEEVIKCRNKTFDHRDTTSSNSMATIISVCVDPPTPKERAAHSLKAHSSHTIKNLLTNVFSREKIENHESDF